MGFRLPHDHPYRKLVPCFVEYSVTEQQDHRDRNYCFRNEHQDCKIPSTLCTFDAAILRTHILIKIHHVLSGEEAVDSTHIDKRGTQDKGESEVMLDAPPTCATYSTSSLDYRSSFTVDLLTLLDIRAGES